MPATATEVNFIPGRDRVLVKPMEKEESRKSGLIIPDTAKEKPQQGTVISVGKSKLNDDGKELPIDYKKGDIILYGKYSGTEIKIDDTDYLILSQEDILGLFSK